MSAAANVRSDVEKNGFAIVEGVLSAATVDHVLTSLERIGDTGSVRKRGGMFAVRNLLDVSPEVRELAHSEAVRALVEPVLGHQFFPVRGILFDKIPHANWKVPWHQDVTIAVQERVEADGFGPWSMKADVLHVQPPAEVLEHMISVRLHLDNCGEENGALRVIPGSHLHGPNTGGRHSGYARDARSCVRCRCGWSVTHASSSAPCFVAVTRARTPPRCASRLRPVARWYKGAYLLAGNDWICLTLDAETRSGSLPEYTHQAFTVAPEMFASMVQRLRNAGVISWQENHSHGASFYFLDPDGHKLELHASDLQSRLESLRQKPPRDLVLY